MELADLTGIMFTILIIIAILVIALMAMLLLTKRRNDIEGHLIAARDDVRSYRKQRLVLVEQALSMFSDNNKFADSLSKLAEIYRTIDSENKEILWEEKYIKVMKKFMAYAKKNSPANMKDAWKMLNSSVNENEMMLDQAREAYTHLKEELEKLDTPPLSYVMMASDKLSDSIHIARDAKSRFDEHMEKNAKQAQADEEEKIRQLDEQMEHVRERNKRASEERRARREAAREEAKAAARNRRNQ